MERLRLHRHRVALGSSLATSILSGQVSLAKGVLVFALLTLLQFVVTWLSVRSNKLQRLIKSAPALLLHEGEFQRKTMLRERVTEGEVRAALRSQGIAAVERVAAVVLETDGSFSVIKEWGGASRSALDGVRGMERGTDNNSALTSSASTTRRRRSHR